MPVFSQQVYWRALLIIWASLACLLWCAVLLSRDTQPEPGQAWFAWLPLSLHAGWLSLAAFLNTAQVIVAYGLLPTDNMLWWSLLLFALAAALLLSINQRMHGNLALVAAAVWALVAVYVKQSTSTLPGSSAAAWVAIGIAVALVVQTIWLKFQKRPTLATDA